MCDNNDLHICSFMQKHYVIYTRVVKYGICCMGTFDRSLMTSVAMFIYNQKPSINLREELKNIEKFLIVSV